MAGRIREGHRDPPPPFSLDVSDGKITEVDCDVIGADVALQIAVLKEAVYG